MSTCEINYSCKKAQKRMLTRAKVGMEPHGASRIKSWYASLPKLPLTPTAVSAPASRSWICSVNRCQLPVQRENMCVKSNPPGPSVVWKRNLSAWRLCPRKLLTLVRAIPRLQMCGNCLERVSKTTGKIRKQNLAGSVRRLDSLSPRSQDQTSGETSYCIVEVTSKDTLDQIAAPFFEYWLSWYRACCPLLRQSKAVMSSKIALAMVVPTVETQP